MVMDRVPNDPFYYTSGSWGQNYPDLWGIHKIDTEHAWDLSIGDREVIVAVIDSGVDYTHEDIQGNMWKNTDEIMGNDIDDDLDGFVDNLYGADFVYDDGDPFDGYGHGTHCAGIIAAMGNNARGVVGVTWQTRIMAVKIFPDTFQEFPGDIVAGMIWAVDQGADILSNSWGPRNRNPYNPLYEDAVRYAYEQGCVIVFSAGNLDDDVQYYSPMNMNETVTVAAADYQDHLAGFSNWGEKITVCAPGVDILSTMADDSWIAQQYPELKVADGYYRLSGTSMACPYVSGLTALLLSFLPDLTNNELMHLLRESADDIDGLNPDYDGLLGTGRINASHAFPPEHDVGLRTVTVSSNHQQSPSESFVNLTISNFGYTNEANVLVSLFVNGVEADTMVIPMFDRFTEQLISFSWVPSIVGVYQISVNITLPNGIDSYPTNNEYTTQVLVGVYNRNSGECYPTIQAAINDVHTIHGHTLVVPTGVYPENIVVSKNISLVGFDRENTIITSYDFQKPVLLIHRGDKVNITGLTFQHGSCGVLIEQSTRVHLYNSCISHNQNVGIVLDESEGCKIEGNDILDNSLGIKITSRSYKNILYHNTFSNTQNAYDAGRDNRWNAGYSDDGGIHPIGGNWWSDYSLGVDELGGPKQNRSYADGIIDAPYQKILGGISRDMYPLINPYTGLLTGTIFVDDDNVYGPWLGTWDNPYKRIRNGVAAASGDGDTVFVFSGTYSDSVTIRQHGMRVLGENQSTTILYGKFFVLADQVTLKGFTIYVPMNTEGVWARSSNSTIAGNIITTIVGHNCGIFFWRSNDCKIIGNTVSYQPFGIWLKNSYYNRVYYNNVINDFWYAIDESMNFWDNGYPCGGNYWLDFAYFDDYHGEHQDQWGSDGIVDHGELQSSGVGGLNPRYIPSLDNDPFIHNDSYALFTPFTGLSGDAHGPYEGAVGIPVQFTGTAVGGFSPYTWLWKFDDGNRSLEQNATHSFTRLGRHTVMLVVTDSEGFIFSVTTTVIVKHLVADAQAPIYGLINEPVQFTGLVVGGSPPFRWSWVFGNGVTSTQQNPVVTFRKTGTYEARLQVSDTSYDSKARGDDDTVRIQIFAPVVWVDDDFTSLTPGWGNDHFASIQAGIDAVSPGGIVHVAEGVYREHVVIIKSLELQGEDSDDTVIDGEHSRPCVSVYADNVIISNFMIRDSSEAGVQLYSDYTTLKENSITGNHYTGENNNHGGVYLYDSYYNTFVNNTLNYNSAGFFLIGRSSYNIIIGNTVSNGNFGIDLFDARNNTISRNVILNTVWGINLVGSANTNLISTNTITNSVITGISVHYCWDTSICDNVVMNLSDTGDAGITSVVSTNTSIIRNRVMMNKYAIHVLDSLGNTNIVDNTLDGILVERSPETVVRGNILLSTGITVAGFSLKDWNTHTMERNWLQGKLIYYYANGEEPLIVPLDAAQVILANCSNVTIQNLEINSVDYGVQLAYCSHNRIQGNLIHTVHSGNIYNPPVSVHLLNSSFNIICDNILQNATYDLWLSYSPNNTIRANTVETAVLYGIWLLDSANNHVEENTITNNTWGINVLRSPNLVINSNMILDNSEGISVEQSSEYSEIFNNKVRIQQYGTGIQVLSSNYINISSNNITSVMKRGSGLVIIDSRGNTIRKNNITNTSEGIYIESSTNIILKQNTIAYNQVGLHTTNTLTCTIYENTISQNEYQGIIIENSFNNFLYHNNFNNTENGYDDGSNIWNLDYPEGGNWWSDYQDQHPDAHEIDDSGIWDLPYHIDGGENTDQYPFINENGWQ
ncbi:MAG: NosD domain-containing protein [Methanobacteriota archaeon]